MIKGTLEAVDKESVIKSLLNQDYFILSLEKVEQSSREIKFDLAFKKVSTRDLVVFTRQLSTMMGAGLSILRCLRILEEQTANKRLKKAIHEVRDDVEEGLPLWEAVSKHPGVFPKIYTSMVRAGELGGVLEAVLDRLSGHLEREQEINSKVKGASIYPIIISIFAVVVVTFIITVIMPTFIGMFQSAGVELPLPTRILLTVSTILRKGWMYLVPGIALIIFLIKRWTKTSSGRMFVDNLYLHLPVIGKTISRIIVARFARTMGTLVRSGIPVLQALEVVEDIVGNAVISRAIHTSRASITEGDSISVPLEETGVFEPMVTQMIAVGEETGALDDMLIRMSDYFDREVMYMVDAMMSIVEPLMIMVVAVLIGGIVVATLLPMFEIMNLVGG